jgi:hypothetical protein
VVLLLALLLRKGLPRWLVPAAAAAAGTAGAAGSITAAAAAGDAGAADSIAAAVSEGAAGKLVIVELLLVSAAAGLQDTAVLAAAAGSWLCRSADPSALLISTARAGLLLLSGAA